MSTVFIYEEPDTLRFSTFMEFLKLSEGGRTFFGAVDRQKNDVPAEIFSQGLENPLSRGQEKPL